MSTREAQQRAYQKRYTRLQRMGLCHRCGKRPRVNMRHCGPCKVHRAAIVRQKYRKSDYGSGFTVAVVRVGIARTILTLALAAVAI